MNQSHEEIPPRSADSSKFSLSVDDASELFATEGTPRSPRTIIRYCAQGHLDCIKVETEQNERYLITRESIDRRIEEIRQVATTSPVSSRRDASRSDSSDRDNDELPVKQTSELRKKIEALEAEIVDQKIANRAKSQYIEQIQAERSMFIEKLQIQSRQIGRLEMRLELQDGSKAGELSEPEADPAATPS